MSCKEIRTCMDGYIDRELDLVRSIDLERHIHDCSGCAELHRSRMVLRTALHEPSLRYTAPADLKKKVRAKLGQQERPRFGFVWIPAAAAAVAAVVTVLIFVRPDVNRVERDVVDSHVRSLIPGHLTDVLSTDQHTVKPWFSGKIDFSPPVTDFATQGFPLVGGRIDYFGDHPVAVVVYRRNQHPINVFAWRSGESNRARRVMRDRGYNIIELTRDGTEFWVVSDLNPQELEQFAALDGIR